MPHPVLLTCNLYVSPVLYIVDRARAGNTLAVNVPLYARQRGVAVCYTLYLEGWLYLRMVRRFRIKLKR